MKRDKKDNHITEPEHDVDTCDKPVCVQQRELERAEGRQVKGFRCSVCNEMHPCKKCWE